MARVDAILLLHPEEAAVKATAKHSRMSSKGATKLHKGGTFQVLHHGRLARRGSTVIVEESRPARRGSSDCTISN
jgi:hypothetical protein